MSGSRCGRLASVVVVVAAAVGGCAAEQGEDAITVSSPLATSSMVCLVPVDLDGDGRGDVMRTSSFVIADPGTCRAKYRGAVALPLTMWNRSPSDDATLRPRATAPAGSGGGGPTYTAGTGVPPAVAAEVARFDLHGRERYRDGYNCRHFSRDLERHLQDEGFHATYTIINSGSGRQRYGHAVVDVHIDGTAWWIEPQTGLPFDLDDDGDGDVETTERGGIGTNSEGGTSVEVFESYDDMVATYPKWR